MKILDFPKSPRQSTPYTCSAAVISAILYYYGKDVREGEISKALGIQGEVTRVGLDPKFKLILIDTTGPSPQQLVKCLNHYGLKTCSGNHMLLEDIKLYIDKNFPVILSLQAYSLSDISDYSKYNNGHYVVAIGYDDSKNILICEDPSINTNRGYLKYKEIDQRWHDIDYGIKSEHFGIVVFGTPKFNKHKLIHIE